MPTSHACLHCVFILCQFGDLSHFDQPTFPQIFSFYAYKPVILPTQKCQLGHICSDITGKPLQSFYLNGVSFFRYAMNLECMRNESLKYGNTETWSESSGPHLLLSCPEDCCAFLSSVHRSLISWGISCSSTKVAVRREGDVSERGMDVRTQVSPIPFTTVKSAYSSGFGFRCFSAIISPVAKRYGLCYTQW